MKYLSYILFVYLLHSSSCKSSGSEKPADDSLQEVEVTENYDSFGAAPASADYVERVDTNGLIVLYPDYTAIDLVCGTIPSKSDKSVILFAEAAYTGQLLKHFDHSNIAGNHVSHGKLYKGYRCTSNGGAFVFYNGAWKFCHKNYAHELDSAAKYGGAAFAQEMLIFNGNITWTARKDNNKNQFRALCSHKDRLCIIESDGVVTFSNFKQSLLNYGVSNAIYLDMGSGWNHAWYRKGTEIVELHPKRHNYCTNWITFYKTN